MTKFKRESLLLYKYLDDIEKLPVFVYGTLRNGLGNYEWCLRGRTTKEIQGTIKGVMYSAGGFPAVVPGDERVVGELMYIPDDIYKATMIDLDGLEGYDPNSPATNMYERVVTEVTLENGEKVKAYTYHWSMGEWGIHTHLAHGDWKKYRTLRDDAVDFQFGKMIITAQAEGILSEPTVVEALSRHRDNDWGDLCKDDWKLNDEAVRNGGRLFSVYKFMRDRGEDKFYIITEWDRNVTTVLMPSDY